MSTSTKRAPVRFANYPGDVRDIVGEVKGPNLFGEYLVAVSADLTGATTRVGFAYATTTDVPSGGAA